MPNHTQRSLHTLTLALFALLSTFYIASCCLCDAVNPAACKISKPCKTKGLCTKRSGGDAGFQCYAATNADCSNSKTCKDDGKCYASEQGTCARKSELNDLKCSNSFFCESRGGCTPKEGRCVPSKDTHCRDSILCKLQGTCHYAKERNFQTCRPKTDKDCTQSVRCKAIGACSYSPTAKQCQPSTKRHCTQSSACRIDGLCALQNDHNRSSCVLPNTPDACDDTLSCSLFDRCTRLPYTWCNPKQPSKCRTFYCGTDTQEKAPTPCTASIPLAQKHPCIPNGQCILNEKERCIALPNSK